jgi:hypothetical protein
MLFNVATEECKTELTFHATQDLCFVVVALEFSLQDN